MFNEIEQFLLQYLFALLGCFTVYLLGRLLLQVFPFYVGDKNNKWQHSYTSIALGIAILVLVYSLAMSKGKTINILILPILAGLFFSREKQTEYNDNKPIFKDWPFVFLIIAPLLFVSLFHLFPESEYSQNDALRYLQISNAFNNGGQENNFGGTVLFGSPFVGTVPYHYFEFWLNAILLKLVGNILPGIQLLRFVCYAIISTAILMGMFALAENILKAPLSFAQKAICVCFIFYIPNFLGYFDFLRPVFIYPFESNILDRPNLRTLFMFLPGIMITIGKKENKWQFLFWLVCTIVLSLINFGVLVAAIVLYCFAMMRQKQYMRYSMFVLCTIFLIAASYFFFYYFTTSNLRITPTGLTKENILAYLLKYWKIILFSSTTSILYCLLIPLLFFIYLKNYEAKRVAIIWKVHQSKIMFFFAVIVCAVIMARSMNFMDDAYQFAYLGYGSGTILFFILLLATPFKAIVINRIYFCVCIIFFLSFMLPRLLFHPNSFKNVYTQNGSYRYKGKKFSNTYLQNLRTVFKSGSSINGCYWADKLFYDSVPYYSNRNPNVYSLPTACILANKLLCNYEVCLSDSASIMYGIDTTQKVRYDYLRSAIFRSVYYQCKQPESNNERRLYLIKRYRLEYIILTKNADTSIISQLPISQHFQDNNTGERFYKLDTARF